VSIIAGKGLVAFREPLAIRPLVYGKRTSKSGKTDYIFASEQTMFHTLGFTDLADVQPGEVIFIDCDRKMHRKTINNKSLAYK